MHRVIRLQPSIVNLESCDCDLRDTPRVRVSVQYRDRDRYRNRDRDREQPVDLVPPRCRVGETATSGQKIQAVQPVVPLVLV